MKAFQRWLRAQLGRVDRLYALLDLGADVESVYSDCAAIADEAAARAAKLGFIDLVDPGLMEPPAIKVYLATCIQRCRQEGQKPVSRTEDGLLRVSEVAKILAVSERTVRDLAASGKLLSTRIGKGRGTLRFSPADLKAYRDAARGTPALLPDDAKRRRLLKL